MAIEAASGTWSGHSYQSGVTPDRVTHRWFKVRFSPAFSSTPRYIAALYTYDEDDSSHLRYQDLGSSSVEVMVEEDTTYDSEMRHTKEKVSWLAIEGDGTLEATSRGTGYHPIEPSTRFAAAVDTEEQKSILGWLGSVIQVIMRPWRESSSYLANQPLQQASPTASASPTGTPLSPTATAIPATATATSSDVPIVSPTPTPEITTTPSVEPSPSESGMEAMDLGLFETLSFGEPVTITYDYDPLYRLTAADYDTGEFFHYTYDAVGNRLTQDTHEASNTYLYDDVNRLIDVDGVTLTWDDNGNLLSDGVSTYTYDRTNRLSSVIQGTDTYSYTYNGLGDRLTQTVNSVPASYTLDIAGGLTQVLSDGTNSYLYGVNRIGELQPGGWQYHLPDALGSVRQLVDGSGILAQARGFEPFGDELEASSITTSVYGFASEWGDATGLTHLRARYYAPWQGRFVSRDEWDGDPNQPMSYNKWLYVYANPITLTDPSGHDPWWCEGRLDEALCQAIWIVQHGGEVTSDLLEPVYMHSPVEALELLRREYNIKLPPGYQFRFASHTSSKLYDNPGVFGFGIWFWEFNQPLGLISSNSTILEITLNSCILRNLQNQDIASLVDYGVYITDLAFTEFSYLPDDAVGVMIHEAVHAWQEDVARDHIIHSGFVHYDPRTFEWHNRYSNGMERQAGRYALNDGRIDMSDKHRIIHYKNIFKNFIGPNYPYELPVGVP